MSDWFGGDYFPDEYHIADYWFGDLGVVLLPGARTSPSGPAAVDHRSLYLRHYSRNGTLISPVIDPIEARYTRRKNEQMPLVFTLPADQPAAEAIAEFDIIEVMYRNTRLGPVEYTRAFVGIVRDFDWFEDGDGISMVAITAPHINHILSWRSVLWPAGMTGKSQFAAEPSAIMAALVTDNLTAAATVAAGRWRAGDLLPLMGLSIAVATPPGSDITVETTTFGGNVLGVLQRVAEVSGMNFDVVWDGGNAFTFAPGGLLGTDRRSGAAAVVLSRDNLTLVGPRYRRSGQQASVALAAGQGSGNERAISESYAPWYGPGNDIEVFVDARSESTEGGRQARGEQRLVDLRRADELTFAVQETAAAFWSPAPISGRRTFDVGDVVLVDYRGVFAHEITGVSVSWSPANGSSPFSVEIETHEYVGSG